MSFKTILCPILLLASGCVSAPDPIVLSEPPPSLAKQDPDGKAEIVVLRKGIMALASTFGVYINDLHVGELHTNDFVHHDVSPGIVEMFAGAEARSPARFPVEANRIYYLRALPKMGWWAARVQLEIMEDPEEAAAMTEGFVDKTFDEPKPFPFELDLPDPASP